MALRGSFSGAPHRARGSAVKRWASWSLAIAAATVVTVEPSTAGQAGAARTPPPPRLFPAFEGTWVLDEQASTGRLSAAPGATVTFEITPTEITLTLTRRRPASPNTPSDGTSFRQVFRVDGTETTVPSPAAYPLGRVLLVSDALVFTTSTPPRDGGFTQVNDAYSVEGGVLIARRQLVAFVGKPGFIATMQEPSNRQSHVFVYRRASPSSQR